MIVNPVPSATWSDTWGAPRSGGRTHKGQDLFAADGTVVRAANAGTVDPSRYGSDGGLGGIRLWINGDQWDTYYAHLSAVLVLPGQRVSAGTPIGRVGRTGNAASTPPHLHFEVHPAGGAGPVNPAPLLQAAGGTGGPDPAPPAPGSAAATSSTDAIAGLVGLAWLRNPTARQAAGRIVGGLALAGLGVAYYWADDAGDLLELGAAVYSRGATTAAT